MEMRSPFGGERQSGPARPRWLLPGLAAEEGTQAESTEDQEESA